MHFLDEKCFILDVSINISLKFVPWGPNGNTSLLVQVMTWRQICDKPLHASAAMVTRSMSPRGAIRQSWINLFRICCAYLHQKIESSLHCSKWLGVCLSPSHYPNPFYLTLSIGCWLYVPWCLRKTFWCWGRKIRSTRSVISLLWRHNGCEGVSNHQPSSRMFTQPFIQAQIKKKTSKFRVTGLSAGNSHVTGEFPTQMANNAEMFPLGDFIMMATDALAPIIVSISAAMILALYDKGALVLLLVRYSLLNLLYFLIDGCIYDTEAKRNNSTLGRLLKSLRVWKPNKKYIHKQHDGEYLNRITN